jgi:hypothetical protein
MRVDNRASVTYVAATPAERALPGQKMKAFEKKPARASTLKKSLTTQRR